MDQVHVVRGLKNKESKDVCTNTCEWNPLCVFVCVSMILILEVWDMVQEWGDMQTNTVLSWGVHRYGVYQFVKQYTEEASDKDLIMETEGGQD